MIFFLQQRAGSAPGGIAECGEGTDRGVHLRPQSTKLSCHAMPPVSVRTTPLAAPVDFTRLPASLTACWLRRADGLIGLGQVWRKSFATPTAANAWWQGLCRSQAAGPTSASEPNRLAPAGSASGPVAFVSCPFDPDHTQARCELVVPQTIVGQRNGVSWVTSWGEPDPAALAWLAENRPAALADPATPAGHPSPGTLDRSAWLSAVAAALSQIDGGRLDKVVLARDELVRLDHPLDLAALLDRLHHSYPETWTFAVAGLVGATPELLVRRDRGLVTSRVLAGTIQRRGNSDAAALAQALAGSGKDLAEHEFAVTSVAAALAPYCAAMNLPETPFVLRLPNVLHLASDITGVARSSASVLQLAAAVHPSAAVCGTPAAAARDLSRQLEGLDRGRYAGPVGWIDAAGDGEIGLALRCGQVESSTAVRLWAGCGLVAGSDPAAEWAEAEAKLLPMRQALGVA